MRVIFMGTPRFAVPSLQALYDSGDCEVILVLTQPDRPCGRGGKVTKSPVKILAERLSIEVFQPLSLRKGTDAEETLLKLKNLNPDLIAVAAYGQILPRAVLDIPRLGCVNVHASLLPKYRGASPINAAIINGDAQTGVTLMYMEEGLDAGDMIASAAVNIADDDTALTLTEKLSNCGAELLKDTIPLLINGAANRAPQPRLDCISYAGMITKEQCRIDFNEDAVTVWRKIRGLPTAYGYIGGKRVKIISAVVRSSNELDGGYKREAGLILAVSGEMLVVCGDGNAVSLLSVTPEGRSVMTGAAFLAGYKLAGKKFDSIL